MYPFIKIVYTLALSPLISSEQFSKLSERLSPGYRSQVSLNKNFHFFLRLIDFHWQTYSSKREKKDVLDRLRGELRAGELKAHCLIGFHRTNLWVSTSGKFNDIQWVFLPETEGRDPADAVEYSCLENMRDLLHWGSRNQKMTVAEI